jgi:hypothetical protein
MRRHAAGDTRRYGEPIVVNERGFLAGSPSPLWGARKPMPKELDILEAVG